MSSWFFMTKQPLPIEAIGLGLKLTTQNSRPGFLGDGLRSGAFWPDPNSLKQYFLAPPGKEWLYTGGNDGARLWIEGLDGTEQLPAHQGRVDADFMKWAIPITECCSSTRSGATGAGRPSARRAT